MIILLSYNFYDSYFDNVEFSREDKNGINVLRAKISRLTTAWKDQENLLHIYDDKETMLKEEIFILKIKLVELKRDEEGMRVHYKEKEDQCERLEVEVMSLRKKRKMEKTIVALENFLEIHISPLDRSGLGFQKGEFSLHADNNNKEEPKIPVTNNNNKKKKVAKEETNSSSRSSSTREENLKEHLILENPLVQERIMEYM